MAETQTSPSEALLDREALSQLLQLLQLDGYQLVGPTLRDGAIVLDKLDGLGDLPEGVTEVQEAGRYRLAERPDQALFGFASGPQSWKRFFFVPELQLWRAKQTDPLTRAESADGSPIQTEPCEKGPRPRLALIGARSCDLHAISIQDKVFLEGPHVDHDYAMRRQDVFVVAVHCGVAGGTCFCVSMQTGPNATFGFDLALTELVKADNLRTSPPEYLVEVGTPAGQRLLDRVAGRPASAAEQAQAASIVDRTAAQMGRKLDTTAIRDLLADNLQHPRWDDVASRCLGCTNCTLVCPTCFCSQIEDVSDLSGTHAERIRTWDSCFTLQHSFLHGGSVRQSIRSRYRQWLTHKLGTWIDQFGTSGCVGCGRCITWCPVGIDITEEVAAIRTTAASPSRTC